MKPGWYNDPQDLRQERYFDGRTWTDRVRADIPDIPLAPWVDPSHPDYAYGHIVDTTPPTSSVRSWMTAVVGVAIIALALSYGIMQTNQMQAHYAEVGGNWGVDVELPPSGGGTSVIPAVTCQDVQDDLTRGPGGSPGFGITGFIGSPTTEADHQPVTSLPTGSTYYLVLRCEAVAQFEDGSAAFLPLALLVDSTSMFTVYVG